MRSLAIALALLLFPLAPARALEPTPPPPALINLDGDLVPQPAKRASKVPAQDWFILGTLVGVVLASTVAGFVVLGIDLSRPRTVELPVNSALFQF